MKEILNQEYYCMEWKIGECNIKLFADSFEELIKRSVEYFKKYKIDTDGEDIVMKVGLELNIYLEKNIKFEIDLKEAKSLFVKTMK